MFRGWMFALGVGAGLFVSGERAEAQFYGGFPGRPMVGPLGFPAGPSIGNTARGGAAVGPFGSAAAGARSRTIVTPGGATIQYGAGGRVSSGLFGGSAVGARGIRVTTPGGRTFTHVEGGGAIGGPRGVIGGGASVGGFSGPFGAGGTMRSGYFVRP